MNKAALFRRSARAIAFWYLDEEPSRPVLTAVTKEALRAKYAILRTKITATLPPPPGDSGQPGAVAGAADTERN